MSKQHYTRNTVEAAEWCARCQKPTMHTIHDRRKGSCTVCMKRLDAEHEARKLEAPKAEQKELF